MSMTTEQMLREVKVGLNYIPYELLDEYDDAGNRIMVNYIAESKECLISVEFFRMGKTYFNYVRIPAKTFKMSNLVDFERLINELICYAQPSE